jgi:hypothetical protein
MSERRVTSEQQLASLEVRLTDLGSVIEFPPTPPIAGLVADRIRSSDGRTRWWRPLPSIGRGAALALVATLLLVAGVAALGFALGGIRLVFTESLPPTPSLPNQPGSGQQVTLEEARTGVGFDLRVPALAPLGNPEQVYLMEPPEGGAVTLVYGARPGYPVQPARAYGLVITQFRADIGHEVFEKLIDTGVQVTRTSVGTHAAYWVAGGNHFFFYVDADGHRIETTLRLAGDTLIWEEDGVTYRVEGAPSLQAAIAVAASLE